MGIDGRDWAEQSHLQGGQETAEEEEVEEWPTAAKPSLKCQYNGGPTMYPSKHTASNPSPAFNNFGVHADDPLWFNAIFAQSHNFSALLLPRSACEYVCIAADRFQELFDRFQLSVLRLRVAE